MKMRILSLFTHSCVVSKRTSLYDPWCMKGDYLKNVHATLQ